MIDDDGTLSGTDQVRAALGTAEPVGGDSAYGLKALDRELSLLRRAMPGTVDAVLKRGAYNLGQLVGAGTLDRNHVERHLLATAMASGLAEPQAREIVERTLTVGILNPRVVPIRPIDSAATTLGERRQREQTQAPAAGLATFDPITWQGKPIPPRRWLVPDWIPDGTVTSLYGDGGVGKSLLALQLATAVATGGTWLGMEVPRRRVLALFCEDAQDELLRRQAAINAHAGIDFGDLEDLKWASRVASNNVLMMFGNGDAGIGEATAVHASLTQEVKDFGAQLVIIDTAADTFGGNENVRNQVRQFIALLSGLALDIDGAVLLCAHPSVDGMTSKRGYAGSTAWSNSVRSRLYLIRPDTDADAPVGHEERVLKREKANYAKANDEVRLRWADGVLAVAEPPAGIFGTIARRSVEQVFIACLRELEAIGRDVTHLSRSADRFAPKVMARMPIAQGTTEKQLRGAMEALLHAKTIKIAYVGPPSDNKTKLVEASPPPVNEGGIL